MKDIEKNGFEQLAEVVNMPTRYFAGSRDACGWFKNEAKRSNDRLNTTQDDSRRSV